MLPLESTRLSETAIALRTVATLQAEALTRKTFAWERFFAAGNGALFLDMAARFELEAHRVHSTTITQMNAVSYVLERTAETMAAVEIDLSRIIAATDQFTQNSQDFGRLLTDIKHLGQAIDRACALEIAGICTVQSAPGHALHDFPKHSTAEIHAHVVGAAPPEVTELLAQFPAARLLPTSDGVALAFGDIDTAPAVTTVIPGVGSASPTSWAGYAQRAETISRTTGTATVLWLDYSAPSSIAAATATAPAKIGASRLQAFQAELRRRSARNGNPQHLTVVGHSYGSVVAGHAANDSGLDADAIVFVGSPGVGARNAAELNLKSDQPIIAATTSAEDVIGLTVTAHSGVHGPDPADPHFGADVWPATGGHSDYWESPEFLARLTELSQRSGMS